MFHSLDIRSKTVCLSVSITLLILGSHRSSESERDENTARCRFRVASRFHVFTSSREDCLQSTVEEP